MKGCGSAGGNSAGPGTGSKGADPDSPRLALESGDRRPSFSYLRRASDRRRRRRLLSGCQNTKLMDESDTGRWRQEYSSSQHRTSDGQMDFDSGREADGRGRQTGSSSDLNQNETQREPDQRGLLRRNQRTYDEAGPNEENQDGYWDEDQQEDEQLPYEITASNQNSQHQSQMSQDSRRQSINDRFTEAVSDVMDFVRDESFRRYKRRSFLRRRAHMQSGTNTSSIGSAHATGTDEANTELDSDVGPGRSVDKNVASGSAYRRRRLMRRSPRPRQTASQAAAARQAAANGAYNDSDTASGASVSLHHHTRPAPVTGPMMIHQQQEVGGQFRAPMLGYSGQPTSMSNPDQSRYPGDGGVMAAYQAGQLDHSGAGMVQYRQHSLEEQQCAPSIPLIPVGASPPPPPSGSVEAELAAARRRRSELAAMSGSLDESDLRTGVGIHLAEPDEHLAVVGEAESVMMRPAKPSSPIRFIAPKVAPLQSPSDVDPTTTEFTYRARRLPQIPGSMFRSAADFIQSSIHGLPPRSRASEPSGTQERASMSFEEGVEFPLVSGSPTQGTSQPKPSAGIVKRKPVSLLRGTSLGVEPGALSSGSVQFPRVSNSPTHGFGLQSPVPVGSLPIAGPASSLIAHQDGTQSTVPGTAGLPAAGSVDPRTWMSLNRRIRRDDEPPNDWF